MADEPRLIRHRCKKNNETAIVFVHGFTGDAKATWGDFPAILQHERALDGWDVLSVGFPTRLRLALVGIWAADPDIATIADNLRTTILNADTDYKSVVLVGHSMGGLAIERAL